MKEETASANTKKRELRYGLRFIVVVLAACIVDCALVLLLKKPLPWAVIVPATIPMWVALFVILPMQKKSQD
jgi:hypothetical protein